MLAVPADLLDREDVGADEAELGVEQRGDEEDDQQRESLREQQQPADGEVEPAAVPQLELAREQRQRPVPGARRVGAEPLEALVLPEASAGARIVFCECSIYVQFTFHVRLMYVHCIHFFGMVKEVTRASRMQQEVSLECWK